MQVGKTTGRQRRTTSQKLNKQLALTGIHLTHHVNKPQKALTFFSVSQLGLGTIHYFVIGPAWRLISTQQNLKFMGLKAPKRVHAEHTVKAVFKRPNLPLNARPEHKINHQVNVLPKVVFVHGQFTTIFLKIKVLIGVHLGRRVVLKHQRQLLEPDFASIQTHIDIICLARLVPVQSLLELFEKMAAHRLYMAQIVQTKNVKAYFIRIVADYFEQLFGKWYVHKPLVLQTLGYKNSHKIKEVKN
ncbi:hypothetical protein BpHYR1_031023 [Brachionus plicatilis]|uniref:Uncharacterized protein n=1 Tax=Brachionus plicatilis TaxID=10195 RepID=A0A3M7PJZ5_BRAPC|nr:hypothetical protein BpHYR1_031023 [Brachionus plicatilis]